VLKRLISSVYPPAQKDTRHREQGTRATGNKGHRDQDTRPRDQEIFFNYRDQEIFFNYLVDYVP